MTEVAPGDGRSSNATSAAAAATTAVAATTATTASASRTARMRVWGRVLLRQGSLGVSAVAQVVEEAALAPKVALSSEPRSTRSCAGGRADAQYAQDL